MHFRTAISVGVIASALVLAACDGPQISTAPTEAPSFSKISPELQYTATLTCNAAASRSYALVIFQGVSGNFLFCDPALGNQVTGTSFSTLAWSILLRDNAGDVKACPRKGEVLGSATHTGRFTCKDVKTGLSAVLSIEPS